MAQKVSLGQLLSTPGALEALRANGQSPMELVSRHVKGDWGEELCEEDKLLNDQSLIDGSRLLSAYKLKDGTKMWVITEAIDDNGYRAATTLLLPSEY